MSDWGQQAPTEQQPLTKEQLMGLAQSWVSERNNLAIVKAGEMTLRKQLSSALFPTPKKGTQRYEFGGGWNIKLVYKLTHKLGNAEKVDSQGIKVSIADQVIDVQNKMEALGEQGKFLSERLIKWTPALSVSEYESLDLGDPIEKKCFDLITEILTIEEASPTLEPEEPKAV